MTDSFEEYLRPTYFFNFDTTEVQSFAEDNCRRGDSPKERAIQLYYAVRDGILYDPYDLQSERSTLRASAVLAKRSGYCVAKAILLAALIRQQHIPARLGFADVTNHLSTRKLQQLMGSNLFIYHGYTEIFLDGVWVKATPAFNLSLCKRFQVNPLEFDGTHDSLFHEFDASGHRHMEYMRDHGTFADLPFEQIFTAYEKQYPNMFRRLQTLTTKDFSREAEEENR